MRTLTNAGRADIAYRFTTQTDYPGWGFMVKSGATTIWELWNGNTADPAMNAQNIVMLLGDLVTWYYENLAGIKSDETWVSFKKVIMKPTLIKGLDFVNATYNSLYGNIKSNWKIENSIFYWDISIPVNSSAILHIPSNSIEKVLINNTPLKDNSFYKNFENKNNSVVVEIQSGNYKVTSSDFTLIEQPKQKEYIVIPEIENTTLTTRDFIDLKIKCETQGAIIRYTTDNTLPDENSEIYNANLKITKTCVVRVRAFKEDCIASEENKANIKIFDKAIPIKDLIYITKYSNKYIPTNADRAIIDFDEGTKSFVTDKKWIGYEVDDMEVVLDLGEMKNVKTLFIRFLCKSVACIFMPESIQVSVSYDNINFTPSATKDFGIPQDVFKIEEIEIPIENIKTRYIKVKAKNHGRCPDWHEYKGKKAWIFCDEIMVE